MPAGLQPFRNSIVRISSPEGDFVGLGYRLNNHLVLTCAHVVAEALGTDPAEQDPPEGALRIDHPFGESSTEDGPPSHEASIEPRGWYPKGVAHGPSDLALLRLPQPMPAPVPQAGLSSALSLAGSRFAAYGGIEGHQENLVLINGMVRQPIGNRRWQLGTDTEYTIEPGCSGGPAADFETGEVLGLIVQDERDPSIPAGFLIAARQIRQALEQAGVEIRSREGGLSNVRAWAKKRIPSPAYDEQQSVLRFTDYYAGRRDRPMPFAGRDDELARLNAWWAAESGSFLLVSGPAGMGKSALLLHWLAGVLGAREAPGVLFLPVSIRFGTSDELSGLRLLHVQLAGLFAEVRFPPEAKPDPTDYRAKIQEGWRLIASSPADRYLLVVDGADEAAGPWLREGVLPYEMPENLAIALSARHKPGHQDGRAWLGELTFAPSVPVAEPLELEPLARDAVGEAITQLGHPVAELVDREGVLDELYRLTDRGDPLLVSLWAAQLWGARSRVLQISVEDLAALEPSFAGFLDQWMEEQERLWQGEDVDVHLEDLDRLLGVLGVAHGPIRLGGLLEVESRLKTPAPWDYRIARKVLDGAGRLVVGNAEASGYTFVHPRLADEFRRRAERLGLVDTAIHRAFAQWGAEVVAALSSAELEPSSCPRYLLRHYTTHVLEAGLPDDEALERFLLPLLQRGWHQARYEEEGVYDGYLGDLERIENVVEKVNHCTEMPVPRLGELIRCVLIRSSITSLTQQVPAELVVALVRAGLWTVERGLRVAGSFDDARKSGVLEGLSADGEQLLKGDTLQRALAAAEGIGSERCRARGLAAVAPHLVGEEHLVERAVAAAGAIRNREDRAKALAASAGQLEGERRQGALKHALAAAEGIPPWSNRRAEALAAVAGHLEGERRHDALERALAAAEGIPLIERSRAEALAAVAGHLEGERRHDALERALTVAEGIENKKDHARALAAVAAQLEGESGLLERALAAAVRIPLDDPQVGLLFDLRAKALLALAGQLEGERRHDALERALVAAVGIHWDGRQRAETLAAGAAQLEGELRHDALELALAVAGGIDNKRDRAPALAAVAGQLKGERRRDALERALAAAEGNVFRRHRAEALGAVAGHLEGEAGLLERALVAAERIGDELNRVWALEALAGHLEGEHRQDALERALAAAEGSWNELNRAEALAAVAGHLEGEPRHDALERALAAAEGIGKELHRQWALEAVAGQLEGEAGLLERALAASETIGNEEYRAEALKAVAGQLEGEPGLVERALAAAEGIEKWRYRAEALAAVAAQLEGEPRQDVLELVLAAAEGSEYEWDGAKALAAVADQLKGEGGLLERTLAAAETIGTERHRAEALAAVADQLEGEPQQDALERALEAAEGIREDGDRAEALAAVAGQLKGKGRLLERALAAAEGIRDDRDRAKALAAVAAQLKGEGGLLERALAAAEGIGLERRRAEALSAVAGQLDDDARQSALERALAAAEGIRDDEDRAKALAAVVRGAEREEAFLLRVFEASTTPPLKGEPLIRCAVKIALRLPPEYESLSKVLAAMGGLPRAKSLYFLRLLAGRIQEVGGVEAVHSMVQAIVDTAEYWP